MDQQELPNTAFPFLLWRSSLLAGLAAGVVSRTLTAPLDRLKLLAQEMRHRNARNDFDLMWKNTLAVYHSDGICAFWKGNGINCLKAGPEHATAFVVRAYVIDVIGGPEPSLAANIVAGASAGGAAQFVWYPVELVKTRVTISSRREGVGVCDCIRRTIAHGGFRELYAGFGANLLGILPHRGLEMGLFFSLQQHFLRRRRRQQQFFLEPQPQQLQISARGAPVIRLPVEYNVAIGFAASFVAQLATYPLNVARTKLQAQGFNGRPVIYNGFIDCIATVVRTRGTKGLYAGLIPNIGKSVPASMLTYVTYTYVFDYLTEHEK